MSKKIKLILGLGVALFIITALGLSKVEAAEVIEKQTKQISNGKIEVITETKEVNGEKVKILKDVKLDFSAKVKGDVNGDGIVSVEDASYMLIKAVADTLNDETKLSNDESNYADINGDGAITVKDAQYVLTYYAKKAAGLNPTWEQVVNEVDSEVNDNNSDTSYDGNNDTDQIRKTGIEGYYRNGDKKFTVYAQFNNVWGNKPYWDGTYSTDGSGITSIATILTGFGVNKNPVDVNNDGIITDGKILPSKVKEQFSKYGLYCSDQINSKDEIIENLKKGNPVLIDVRNGKIGNISYGGNYLALLGIADNGEIFLADSANSNNTGYFNQDQIFSAIYWSVYISQKSEITNKFEKYDGTLDFDINTDHQNSLPKLNEEQLRQIVNNSDSSQEAKNNMLSVIPDLVKYQDKYKVNAVFVMALIQAESGWGTGWDLIDPSTYNWASILGNLNGGYIDRNGKSWNKYNNFSEATEPLFQMISDPKGYYFGNQKYTIHKIGVTWNNESWSSTISSYIQYFYDIININIK